MGEKHDDNYTTCVGHDEKILDNELVMATDEKDELSPVETKKLVRYAIITAPFYSF